MDFSVLKDITTGLLIIGLYLSIVYILVYLVRCLIGAYCYATAGVV
jgi:hypothetical protein